MRQSIQVPTGSLDVRGPFGQDLRYGAAGELPSPLVHEIRRSGVAIAGVIHRVCTIVPRRGPGDGRSGPSPGRWPGPASGCAGATFRGPTATAGPRMPGTTKRPKE